MKKYHKETFDHIPQEKRDKILHTAIKEFAKNGLVGTKVGDIAKEAGISHGSMYSYFPTKDALINTIILKGFELQKQALFDETAHEADFFKRLEKIFVFAQKQAKSNPQIIALWNELSLEFNARFSRHIIKLEEEAIGFWKDLVKDGQKAGAFDKNLDPDATAFTIDSMLGNLMRSYMSKYEQSKFAIYFPSPQNEEKMTSDLMTNLRKMLTPA